MVLGHIRTTDPHLAPSAIMNHAGPSRRSNPRRKPFLISGLHHCPEPWPPQRQVVSSGAESATLEAPGCCTPPHHPHWGKTWLPHWPPPSPIAITAFMSPALPLSPAHTLFGLPSSPPLRHSLGCSSSCHPWISMNVGGGLASGLGSFFLWGTPKPSSFLSFPTGLCMPRITLGLL